MITQDSRFSAVLTTVGERKQAAAIAANLPWVWTHMGVGDAHGADPLPDPGQKALINERYRAALNQVAVTVTRSQVVYAELIIPATAGGWWIRETGLYDSDGDLIAVANCPASYKPVISQGAGKTQVVRMNLAVAGDAQVTLMIDDTPVIATHQYVSQAIMRATDAVREQIAGPEGVTPGNFRQVEVDRRGLVVGGSNPTTLGGYRISDAYTKEQTYSRNEVNKRVDIKPFRDSITHVGFAENNPARPYFRRESDNRVYTLQPHLGFAPVQQGGGTGHVEAKIHIGWNADANVLSCNVNTTHIGAIWTDHIATRKAIVAQAEAMAGEVGSYAMLILGGGYPGIIAVNTLTAGAGSYYGNAAGVPYSNQTAAGTWRVMGCVLNADGSATDSTTLCLRVY